MSGFRCPKCDAEIVRDQALTIASAITRRQRELLDFIAGHLVQHQRAPTYDEMNAVMGVKSNSSVQQFVAALRRGGMLEPVLQQRTCRGRPQPLKLTDKAWELYRHAA